MQKWSGYNSQEIGKRVGRLLAAITVWEGGWQYGLYLFENFQLCAYAKHSILKNILNYVLQSSWSKGLSEDKIYSQQLCVKDIRI